MYFDMAFKDFTHLRWLCRNNSISGRTSFKTNTMFTLSNLFSKSVQKGGQKYPKKLSTWFMDGPNPILMDELIN